MNRPTFVTMSTLVVTLIAYATLAQTARASDAATVSMVPGVFALLEKAHAPGR